MAENISKDLKIKFTSEKPEVKILKREDVAYIKLASFPSYPLKHKFLNENIIAYIDKEKREILGFTIINLTAFIKQLEKKKYLKERAKESVHDIINAKNFPAILPLHIISQLHIRI